MTSETAPLHPASPAITRAGKFLARVAVSLVLPFVAIVVLFAIWEVAARAFAVPVWLVPKPSDFLGRIATDWPLLLEHAWVTALTIAAGFAIGILIAVPLALLIVSVPALERGLYPVIVFLNIMPKTVIGPILIVWFGVSIMVSVLIVFLMSFFPVLVDAMSGFRALDPRLRYITRSMGASRWQTFRHIRLPAAMPSIYAGMRIGVVKAVEGVNGPLREALVGFERLSDEKQKQEIGLRMKLQAATRERTLPMSNTENVIVAFAQAMAGIQEGPRRDTSNNVKTLGLRVALEAVEECVNEVHQSGRESMIAAVAGKMQLEFERSGRVNWIGRNHDNPFPSQRAYEAATLFVDEVWAKAFSGRSPASKARRIAMAIYQISFENEHRRRFEERKAAQAEAAEAETLTTA